MQNPTKRYDIFFESRSEYLYARVRGYDLNPKIALDYIQDVVEEARKRNYECIMINKDIPETLSNDEVLEVAEGFAAMDIRDMKIAFIDAGTEDLSQNPFVALVGRNRGIRAEAFTGEWQAEMWLLQ